MPCLSYFVCMEVNNVDMCKQSSNVLVTEFANLITIDNCTFIKTIVIEIWRIS